MVDTPGGDASFSDVEDKLRTFFERTKRELKKLEEKTTSELNELSVCTKEEFGTLYRQILQRSCFKTRVYDLN